METVLMIIGGIIGFLIALPFLALALAKFNLFFTLVDEGSAKVILFNKQFYKVMMRYRGFRLKEENYDVMPVSQQNENIRRLLRLGGLEFIGIWPFYTVHKYRFRWTKIKRELKDGKLVKSIEPEDKTIDYILVQADVYYARLEGIETIGLVPLDMEFVLTIRIINPYKALFRTQDWFEYVVNRLLPYIRQFCSGKEFNELIQEKQHSTGDLYRFLEWGIMKRKGEEKTEERSLELSSQDEALLKKEGKTEEEIEQIKKERRWGIIQLLREIYGIDVMGVEIDSIVPEKRYEEIASKQWEATREAERIETVYGKIIKDYGESGLIIRYLESLDKAATKEGNWIIPFGLRGALSDLRGGLKGGEELSEFLAKEGITKEDLKILIDKIKSEKERGGK